jgi:hypothetical protein
MKKYPTCQNCHFFQKIFVHKRFLFRCRSHHKEVFDFDGMCDFWVKRYYPPYHYLTVK